MLLKIREKSQGVFAWIILLLICVPFALWGIQNYIGGGTEASVAKVGDREFFQNDLNQAYNQFSQSLAGTKFDENEVKRRALDKMISDEVLLQYVQDEGLVVTDQAAKQFIKSLDYFQTDGLFDNKQYKALLAAQRMSPKEFVARIKKALVMEQFQRSVTESAFATTKDIENFFRIQNQKRNVEMVAVELPKIDEQPSDQELDDYYQQNQDKFLTKEQVSIEYIELSLDQLAKQVEVSVDELNTYYKEQKDQYTTKERRKISHILFAFTKNTDDDKKQLNRAVKAKQALGEKDFAALAAELSDDKLTASKGGDLGLFNVGVMEQSFEDAATSLKLGEVSEPVKSAFGYHLIKVTELVASETKSFDEVKDELTIAYQRVKAETSFYEMGETLTEVSYETPDNLLAVVDATGLEIKKTELFGKNAAENPVENLITTQAAVVNAAFSEDVLKGNNSEPIELGSDKLLVLRMLEHKPAEAKSLNDVKPIITAFLLNNKAKKLAEEKAEVIKTAVTAGKTMAEVAKDNALEVQSFSGLTRANGDLPWQVNQAVFKAAKPVDGKPTIVLVAAPSGAQTIINVLAVVEGEMSAGDKAKLKLAEANMANAFGQADFNATLQSLREDADITITAAE